MALAESSRTRPTARASGNRLLFTSHNNILVITIQRFVPNTKRFPETQSEHHHERAWYRIAESIVHRSPVEPAASGGDLETTANRGRPSQRPTARAAIGTGRIACSSAGQEHRRSATQKRRPTGEIASTSAVASRAAASTGFGAGEKQTSSANPATDRRSSASQASSGRSGEGCDPKSWSIEEHRSSDHHQHDHPASKTGGRTSQKTATDSAAATAAGRGASSTESVGRPGRRGRRRGIEPGRLLG